jgi:hypothetical protein
MEHVFWLRAYDDGKAGSFVWDGVAGPQFNDLVLVDKSPLVFSPDKHHVAWIGKRGETFVVVVDNAIRCELSNVDMEAIPAVSNSGRIALVATVGTRRVIIDGSPFTNWEAEGALGFSADGDHFAFVAREGPRWRVVVDGATAGPTFDQVGSGSLGTGPETVVSAGTARGSLMAQSVANVGMSWLTERRGLRTTVSMAYRSSAPTGSTSSIRPSSAIRPASSSTAPRKICTRTSDGRCSALTGRA